MWVLEACFDGEEAPIRKGLKPGHEYHFGRKAPADLILADKTVSRESATIYVGAYTPSEEHNPPELKIRAHKRLIRIIPLGSEEEWRQDEVRFVGETVDPDSERVLTEGENVVLTKSAPSIKVLWLPMIFSVSTKVNRSEIEQRKADCDLLGITLERSKQFVKGGTHLVAQSIMYTMPLLTALVSVAPIVTIEYVDEIIRRWKQPKEEQDSLERLFKLPNAEPYFPKDIPANELMTARETREKLVANENRRTLFVGTTLLLLHSEGGVSKSIDQSVGICKMAGARIVTCDASSLVNDESMLHSLRRNKSEAETHLAKCGEKASQAPDEGLVVVCSNEDTKEEWYNRAVYMTRKLNIAMTSMGADAIVQAILQVDARQYLNQMAEPIEPLDEYDAETLPPTARTNQANVATQDSQTQAIEQRAEYEKQSQARPQRQTTPAPPTMVPSTAVTTTTIGPTQPSPRKPRRRADMARHDPLEDLFGSSMAISSTAEDRSQVIPSTAEETQRPATRFRRTGGPEAKRPRQSETWRKILGTDDEVGGAGDTEMEGAAGTIEGISQSKIRKYRQELDEADRLASQGKTAGQNQVDDSQPAIPSKQVEQTASSTRKRRAQSPPAGEPEPTQQRQRHQDEEDEFQSNTEEVEMEQSQVDIPASTTAPGQVHREVPASTNDKSGNTDTKFLQAMATSRKSKKMDEYDKEFNLLRVVKPNHKTGHHGKIIVDEEDPEYRAWEQMGPSDFDINAAGNFVQVDFVPLIFQRSEEELQERARLQEVMQREWQGKPNFKKFKTKQRAKRIPVDMDVEEGADYGVGDGYARPRPRPTSKVMTRMMEDEEAMNEQQDLDEVETVESQSRFKHTQNHRRNNGRFADTFSSEDDERLPPSNGRTSKQPPAPTQARLRRGGRTQTIEIEDDDDGGELQESQQTSRNPIDVRLNVDVDLDDSISYQTRRRSRTPASVQSSTVVGSKRNTLHLSSDDDDDDDNGESSTFRGFRKKRRT